MTLSRLDETLLIQVEFKTSGSNVHVIKNIVSGYRLSAHIIAVMETLGQDPSKEVERLKRLETVLRAFVTTGALPKIGAD